MQDHPETANGAPSERRQLWVMGYMAGAVTVLYNGMPVVIGALANERHLPAAQLGEFSAAAYLGQLCAVGSAFFWIHRADWRATLRWCALGAIAACAVMAYARAPWLLIASSWAAGASMGAGVALTLSYWGSARNAPRTISSGNLSMVLAAAVFLYAVPTIFTPHLGMRGGPLFMILLLLPLFPLSRLIPARAADPSSVRKPSGNSAAALAGLILMGIYFFGIFAVWSFFERIGSAQGLDPHVIGVALSSAMLVGALVLVFTTILGERLGLLPLAASFVLWVAFFMLLLRPESPALFVITVLTFNLAWNLGMPYQIAIVARADVSGRLLVLMPAFQATGAAGGPWLAGQFVGNGQFTFAYVLLAIGVAISSAGYGVLAWIGHMARPTQARTVSATND